VSIYNHLALEVQWAMYSPFPEIDSSNKKTCYSRVTLSDAILTLVDLFVIKSELTPTVK